ncbi:sigma-70 family RNA polymerase sigma factor [Kitasatospora sp. NPDC036755]|uniref:RNA polymerase sigma factor n=1 Tax=Kitasatospora sp. NPDC036755 TaxID=3154600 RepID=UPI00340A35A2
MPFETAYGLYYGGLVRSVRARAAALGLAERDADAEAIVQDTFEEALRVWDTVRIPRAWLHTVARRRVAGCVPGAMRRAHGDPAGHAELGAVRWSPAVPAAGAEDFAAAREVTAVIRGMPQRRRRQVAYLRYVMGWDYGEIAEQLGCCPATARVHARNARLAIAGSRLVGGGVGPAGDDPEAGSASLGTVLVMSVVLGVLGAGCLAGRPWATVVVAAVAVAALPFLARARRFTPERRRWRYRTRRTRQR